jgi:hypothetical protein
MSSMDVGVGWNGRPQTTRLGVSVKFSINALRATQFFTEFGKSVTSTLYGDDASTALHLRIREKSVKNRGKRLRLNEWKQR